MGPMAQPQETPEEAVIEFGPETAPRRRFAAGDFLTELGRDRRVVPLIAGLGALALFASVLSEWQVTSIDGSALRGGSSGSRLFAATVGELGGWGAGYLAGLFLLVPAVVLTLFGPPAGRLQARLAALGVGGTLLAVIMAAGSELGETSAVIGRLETVVLDDAEMTVALGRGVWCAAAGVILMLVSVWLAGREILADPSGDPPARPRRQPREEEDERPQAPFELEVSAAKPWQVTGDRPGGISG